MVAPCFGYNWPQINLCNTLNKGQSYDNAKNSYLLGTKLTNWEEFWDFKELEVHKIVYE